MKQRRERLAAAIQRSVARELLELFPGEHITVTEVEMTSDSKFATIWISILHPEGRNDLFEQVLAHKNRLRQAIAQGIQMRRVPGIDIKLDFRGERAQEISRLAKE